MDRLEKQIEFLLEADKMKNLYRQTYIINDESRGDSIREFEVEKEKYKRRENDAEHSFHLALFVIMLAEHSQEKIDVLHTLKMVLIHDIVEIDAGDTYCYDEQGYTTKEDRETRAAERLFGILPDDQKQEYINLWQEFEERKTPEAKFAAAVDRLQPMLLNAAKGGISWKEHGVKYEQVCTRIQNIKDGSDKLGDYIQNILDKTHQKGIIK